MSKAISDLNYQQNHTGYAGGVANNFGGLLKALHKERMQAPELHSKIVKVEKCNDNWMLTMEDGAASNLLELKEEWDVAAKCSETDQATWYGRVVDLDLREPSQIVVSVSSQYEGPAAGEEVSFTPPDFLRIIRDWANNSIENNFGLPLNYRRIADGKFVGGDISPLDRSVANNLGLRLAQRQAVELLNDNFGIVWGPPGTGKTFTLGNAASLAESSRKVIVLAPTNVAADQAAMSIDNAFQKRGINLPGGKLIRPGNVCLPELEQRQHLMAWSDKQKELRSEIEAVRRDIRKARKKRNAAKGDERIVLIEKLADLNCREKALIRSRNRELWQLTNQASIIVSTIHSFLANESVIDELQDKAVTLILDEASMIPRFMFARLLELNIAQLLLFGDFKQLSPIRLDDDDRDANSKFWVADSALDVCGLREYEDALRLEKEGKLVMLTEQNRMNTDLCDVVSTHFYGGRLTTVGNNGVVKIFPNMPAKSILIVNPEQFQEKFAKLNPEEDKLPKTCPLSVYATIAVGQRLLENDPAKSLLLLTPFKNQARLLKKSAQNELLKESFTAGTVHISQGQEADVVIFSPVDPLHDWLMGEYGRKELERLLCVAFSRARHKIIVVASPREIYYSVLLSKLCATAQVWMPQ